MAEQRTLNPQVLGSNPRGRTFPQVKGLFRVPVGARGAKHGAMGTRMAPRGQHSDSIVTRPAAWPVGAPVSADTEPLSRRVQREGRALGAVRHQTRWAPLALTRLDVPSKCGHRPFGRRPVVLPGVSEHRPRPASESRPCEGECRLLCNSKRNVRSKGVLLLERPWPDGGLPT